VDEQLQNSLNDGSTCIIRQSLQPVISRIQALLMYGFQCIRFTKQSVWYLQDFLPGRRTTQSEKRVT